MPHRARPDVTPRRRQVIAGAGALGLNGLILGALTLGGTADRLPEADRAPDPMIWLSLEPWPATRAGTGDGTGSSRPDDGARAETPSVSLPLARASAGPGAVEGRAVDAAPSPGLERPPEASAPDLEGRIARSLRARLGCTPAQQGLTGVENDACASRMVRDAAPIHGSGDPRRDRRLERQGARQLEAYAARRAPASAARPRCDDAGPISDCGVDVSVEIFSSIDGFFPGLRGKEDD